MKQLTLFSGIMFSVFLLGSCTDTKSNQMIIGNWAGAEWLIDGKPSDRDIQSTGFQFDSTGRYSFNYGETQQKGTYKIENDMLFTTPAGEHEIMVKIKKLTKDSLVFDMNRAGQAEMLTLIKKY